jgi:hypothetical protein
MATISWRAPEGEIELAVADAEHLIAKRKPQFGAFTPPGRRSSRQIVEPISGKNQGSGKVFGPRFAVYLAVDHDGREGLGSPSPERGGQKS